MKTKVRRTNPLRIGFLTWLLLLIWCGYISPGSLEYKSVIKEVRITAYSPSRHLTDDTPFKMASGKVATPKDLEQLRYVAISRNLKKLGIKYGDTIFIGFEVQDLMSPKSKDSVDIFFRNTKLAKLFGLQKRKVIFFLERKK